MIRKIFVVVYGTEKPFLVSSTKLTVNKPRALVSFVIRDNGSGLQGS